MRTFTLLAALLLLAFPAWAQTLQETADQVPAQDQPGAEDQDLFGDEDQDVAVSFPERERLTRQLTGETPPTCRCGLHPLQSLVRGRVDSGLKIGCVHEVG